jgi:transcriptional regulator with XRE-family HTH domain
VSDHISERQLSLWEKFEHKGYRDGFVSSHLANNIAAQIYSTRELRGWTQEELAEKAGMAQARICVMENSTYDKYSLSTLKRLASALDVALIVRFAPFSELAEYATSMGPDRLAVRDFKNDCPIGLATRAPATTQAVAAGPINVADLPAGQVIFFPNVPSAPHYSGCANPGFAGLTSGWVFQDSCAQGGSWFSGGIAAQSHPSQPYTALAHLPSAYQALANEGP